MDLKTLIKMKDDFDMDEVEDMFDGFDDDNDDDFDGYSANSTSDDDSDDTSLEESKQRMQELTRQYEAEHGEEIKQRMLDNLQRRHDEWQAQLENKRRAQLLKEEKQRRELELKEKDPVAYNKIIEERQRKKEALKEAKRAKKRKEQMIYDARAIKKRKKNMSTITVSSISIFLLYTLIKSNIGEEWGFWDCFGALIIGLILLRTFLNKRKQIKESKILEKQFVEKYGDTYDNIV